jgi:hypothetical protein
MGPLWWPSPPPARRVPCATRGLSDDMDGRLPRVSQDALVGVYSRGRRALTLTDKMYILVDTLTRGR